MRLATTSQELLDTPTQLQAYSEAPRVFFLMSCLFLALRESKEALLNNNRSRRRGEPRTIPSKRKCLETKAATQ